MNSKLLRPKKLHFVGYLAPAILVYGFIVVVPVIMALIYSFYNWSGGPKMSFIGLQNYINLIKDGTFWFSFRNNLIITLICVIGQIGVAFVITGLMMSRLLKLKEFHRTVIFIPVVISAVVVGFIWNMIYNKDYGFLNYILKLLNLESWIKPWLDDPRYVIYSVSIPVVWQFIGLYLIIFMSAVQGIPKEVFESAEIDGASGIKRAFYITIPLLYDTLKVAVMLCIAGNMKIFDSIYVMTGGGPGKYSTVMAQYAYDSSFIMFKFGYGSTVSIGIMILSLTLILLSRKLMGGKRFE
jgi:raffinose/stachyose/melibiose transport system permease protein